MHIHAIAATSASPVICGGDPTRLLPVIFRGLFGISFSQVVSPVIFASHANADVLMGTVKPPPARAIRKSVPPGVAPNFPSCPVRSAPAKRDSRTCAIRPRLAQLENLKRRLQMTDST